MRPRGDGVGLLGFTSLGYWVADARARDRYDEMMLFILLGAGIVLLGDVVSAVTRAFVRDARRNHFSK